MKRKKPLFLYSLPLLLLLGTLVVSCGNRGSTDSTNTDDPNTDVTVNPDVDDDSDDPNDDNDSGGSTVVPGDGSIAGAGLNDIYDYNDDMTGSTRPNYEDIFDYESDYEPDVPDPSGTVSVTFVLPDGVTLTDTFLNYYAEVETYGNVFLPTGDSEYLVYSEDITVEGWATYSESSDTYTLVTGSYYALSREDVTLYAYVSDSRGDNVSEFDRNSGTNMIDYTGTATITEGSVTDVSASSTQTGGNYSWKSSYLVNGKLGGKLTYDGTLTDSFARFLSRPQNDSGYYSLVNGITYDVGYTLVNYGSETITIQISTMSSMADYLGGVLSSWYTLAPNESVDFTNVYTESRSSGTSNLLTGFVVSGTVTDFSVGFQIALSVNNEGNDAKLILGNNHAYTSQGTEFNVGEAPSNSEFSLSTDVGDRTLLGWYYDTSSGRVLVDSLNDIVTTSDLTVYPYFSEYSGYTKVDLASGHYLNRHNASNSSLSTYAVSALSTNTAVNGDNGVADLGSSIIISTSLDSSDYFRFDSTGTMTAEQYSFIYSFENYGSEQVSFTIYQVNSGTDTSSFTGSNSATVTLDPGCYGTVQLVATSAGTNQNLLSYFDWSSTNSSVNLKCSLQYRLATSSDQAKTTLEVYN